MPHANKRLVISLLGSAILMFGFTFAMVPLYTVFCAVTGLNGKVDLRHPDTFTRYKIADANTHKRHITVEFDTNRNQQALCEFSPEHTALQVIPGELTHTSYYVKNLTNKKMIIQAIPSISPGTVAKYLKKLDCFCFNQQVLKAGEAMHLPLRFWLEPEFPNDIHRLTLSYTLFDVTSLVKENET
jgi:cytochrome c oxidase assembly protein subunit 11